MTFTKHWLAGMIAMLVALSLVAGAGAQDTDGDDAPESELFVTIYQAACDDLGAEPVSQLGNLASAEEVADGMEADVEIMGFQDVEEMLVLEINLEAGIEALFQQDQVLSLVVMDGQATDDGYVVCGELGGFMVNGQIAIALTGANDADSVADVDGNEAATGVDDEDAADDDVNADADDLEYVGVAVFGSGEGDPEQTSSLTLVRVYVFQTVIAEVTATPEATATVETIADPVFVPTLIPATAPPPPPPLPTGAPAGSPTSEPTTEPTASATVEPTTAPTTAPTVAPTTAPTTAPTIAPTAAPTETEED